MRDVEPWDMVVLDIETHNPPLDVLKAEFEAIYNPPGNCSKPETLEEKKKEAWEKWQRKASMSYSAPINTVGFYHPGFPPLIWMVSNQQISVSNIQVNTFPTLTAMLETLDSVMAPFIDEDTVIVGHNIIGFDLPKLRHAYAVSGLKTPDWLGLDDLGKVHQPVFDTMVLFERFYRIGALDNKAMHSVDELCAILGLTSHKPAIDGSQVPKLYADGQHQLLAAYNAADVITEYAIFERLSRRRSKQPVVANSYAPQPVTAATSAVQPAQQLQPATTQPAFQYNWPTSAGS